MSTPERRDCAIAREMLSEVGSLVEGVQVSAPFGKVPYALDVFAALEGYPTLQELEEQMKG